MSVPEDLPGVFIEIDPNERSLSFGCTTRLVNRALLLVAAIIVGIVLAKVLQVPL